MKFSKLLIPKIMKVIKNRYIYLSISLILFIISLFLIVWTKLNLWIDMTWWIQIEYSYEKNLNIQQQREKVDNLSKEITYNEKEVINGSNLYKISWENKISVVAWFDNSIEEKSLEKLKNEFREKSLLLLKKSDENIIETKYTNIWKSFWDYIKNTAKVTLAIAIISIALYVAWAFSWVVAGINIFSFSSITIITLFHDVLIASWLYVLLSVFFAEFKIDTFFITALLTILGYSINDTIVVFDRVRANLKNIWKTKKNLKEIIDFSINETITRSIYTSLTLLFVLFTIFFFWPESLRGFTIALIFGTIIWTYSSIFIASPLLYEINKNKDLKTYKKKEVNNDDKIVV